MRGDERIQDGMFSYVSLEQQVPQDHPLRAVRKLTDAVLRTLSPEFDALYADSGRPSIAPESIDSAGVYSACAVVAGVLLCAFGAFAGRADRLQPIVPLVCGLGHGRCGVEPCGVLEEPRPVADVRCSTAILCRSEPAGEEVHERRALHSGRHADSDRGPNGKVFVFSCAAHNLIRLPRLMAQPPARLREKCA